MKYPNSFTIFHKKTLAKSDIMLPASKSESNRMLILNSLCKKPAKISNLSEARDTVTMKRLLQSDEQELNVIDAGTTMRFLTAFHAISKEEKILTGTARMCERPIKILVDALLKLGTGISYLEKDGFPPTLLKPFSGQKENLLSIPGNVSSQYISALIMIAPTLEKGLIIELTGKIGSRPYIEMTLSLMKMYGIKHDWRDNVITVQHQEYQAVDYTIESDWSGASYWYSFVALADTAEIKLLGLRKNSLQGDIAIVEIMNKLGVKSTFDDMGVLLQKTESINEIDIDFSDCPDLAQTAAVICAAKNIRCKMTGLESLRIKETDRIAALQNELAKFNAQLTEVNDGEWLVTSGEFSDSKTPITFDTYDDHRMAMAFAPLAMKFDIIIKEPAVVQKSYPRYWQNLEQVGLVME